MLTPSETAVLRIFRLFLMAPGQMLCLHRADADRLRDALRQLIEKRLLVKEKFQCAFSLTSSGFEVMRSGAAPNPVPHRNGTAKRHSVAAR